MFIPIAAIHVLGNMGFRRNPSGPEVKKKETPFPLGENAKKFCCHSQEGSRPVSIAQQGDGKENRNAKRDATAKKKGGLQNCFENLCFFQTAFLARGFFPAKQKQATAVET